MSDVRLQVRGDIGYVALHAIVVGSGADERTIAAGVPLPNLTSHEIGRLQALGAIALASDAAAEGPSASRVEHFTRTGEAPSQARSPARMGPAPARPNTLPDED